MPAKRTGDHDHGPNLDDMTPEERDHALRHAPQPVDMPMPGQTFAPGHHAPRPPRAEAPAGRPSYEPSEAYDESEVVPNTVSTIGAEVPRHGTLQNVTAQAEAEEKKGD